MTRGIQDGPGQKTDDDCRAPEFPVIWNNYYPRLTVYLRRAFGITHREEVEELVQEILLKVYRNLDRYDKKHALSTWIYRIARNCSIDYLRKRDPRGRKILQYGSDEGVGIPMEVRQKNNSRVDLVAEDLLKKEEREAVRRALESLHREDRSIIFLRYYEEMSYREIGKILKIPEGTVKSRCHRIRGELRILLKEVL